jgi:hypothetical protein
MTSIIETAQAFLEQTKNLGRDAFKALYAALTPDVKKVYRQLSKAEFFTPERAKVSARKEHLSPSGKYKLVVTPFETSPGSWAYTQGLVFVLGQDTPIAEIQRNYSSFQFLWVEGHPKGDFLVGGEDYQGQTVIELGSGKRLDFLPSAAEQGHGFCWVEMQFDPTAQLVIVAGCIWACPFEYRFYDFSDPMTARVHGLKCNSLLKIRRD